MNRIGQLFQPKATWYYRPICVIESSTEHDRHCAHYGPCTLHVVRYPDGYGNYMWECEIGYKFEPVKEDCNEHMAQRIP